MGAKECAGNATFGLVKKSFLGREGLRPSKCRLGAGAGRPSSTSPIAATSSQLRWRATERVRARCGAGVRGRGGVNPSTGGSQLLALPASASSPSSLLPCSLCLGCVPPKRTQRCQQAALLGQRHRAGIDGRRPWPLRVRPAGLRVCDLGGGCGEFIAQRLLLPRRGGRLFSSCLFLFPEDR